MDSDIDYDDGDSFHILINKKQQIPSAPYNGTNTPNNETIDEEDSQNRMDRQMCL